MNVYDREMWNSLYDIEPTIGDTIRTHMKNSPAQPSLLICNSIIIEPPIHTLFNEGCRKRELSLVPSFVVAYLRSDLSCVLGRYWISGRSGINGRSLTLTKICWNKAKTTSRSRFRPKKSEGKHTIDITRAERTVNGRQNESNSI